MAERERQAWRGAHHDPAASPTGPDPNGLLTQPDPAHQERELEAIRASAARTSNVTAEREDEYAAAAASVVHSTQTPPPSWTSPKNGPMPTSTPTPGPSTAPSWTTKFGPGALIPPRSCCPRGKDSNQVGSTSPPPSSTLNRSARTPTSGLVNSNAIPTPADWKPKPPASKPSARSKPTKTTAPKYRRPSTPTVPGRAVGQRHSSRARPTAPTPHRRSPRAWGPAENSPSPTGTKPAPRAGNAEPEPPPRLR